jgi:hypothetical protein
VTATLAVVELAMRLPIQLSRGQSLLVVAVVAGLLLSLLVGTFLEGMLGGVIGLVLRLTGHQPPRKSSFRMALDEMEARLKEKEK